MTNTWLKMRRLELGITQSQYAERLSQMLGREIARETVSHWEQGRYAVLNMTATEDLQILAASLDWSIIELLAAIGVKTSPAWRGVLPDDVLQIVERLLEFNESQRAAVLAMIEIVAALPTVNMGQITRLKNGEGFIGDEER